MVEQYAYFSISGGKFHKLAGRFERSQAWRPTLTACGITVTPLNYFEDDAAVNRHTNNRLTIHLCN